MEEPPDNQSHPIREHPIVRSVGIVAGLFVFHTAALFYTAFFTERLQHLFHKLFGMHFAGMAVVLISFMALMAAHLFEGFVWGIFLRRQGLLSGLPENFYFALSSLSAVGYGDVVLPKRKRFYGPIMATSGLLMFGCSTAFLFLVIQRAWEQLPKSLVEPIRDVASATLSAL